MSTNNHIDELSAISPSNIGGNKFVVPLYQRLFAWSGKEVKGLLDDLLYHFNKFDEDPYYLGVVTTIRENERYLLIDGQQRFTVLMIMASLFSQFAEQDGWREFFDGGKRLELYAREEDSAYLKSLASNKLTSKIENLLMKSAYIVIRDFMNGLEEMERKSFMDNCYRRIKLFNSVLPRQYLSDPSSLNKYFEVMNSAGVNLEQHEVLKVLLLKDQPDQQTLLQIWNLCSDFSRPLLKKKEDVGDKEYSDEYVELFRLNGQDAIKRILSYNSISHGSDEMCDFKSIAEIETEAQNFGNPFSDRKERSVLSFPEFLLLTLDLYKKGINGGHSFYKTDKLIERFEENLETDEVTGFYEMMLKLRIALDCYVIRRRLDGQESDYNLVFNEGNWFDHDCLEQYEAMLSVSTPYYKWLKALLKTIREGSTELSSSSLLDFLKGWDNAERSLPDVAKMSYENIDRYWFWRLDYLIWEDMARPMREESDKRPDYLDVALGYRDAILEYSFRANRSIEHLHPQDQKKNEEWERVYIDSFGNLAMISQSFNSQQNNDEVNVKFSRLETQARDRKLQSLKLLIMYASVKGNPDGWSVEESKGHEKLMYERLRSSFPAVGHEDTEE